MSRTHRRPTTTKYTTYSLFTIAILPLAITFLPFLASVWSLAAGVSSGLVVLKVLLEWRHHCRQAVPTRRVAPRMSSAPAPRLVQVQAPLAGCYLCGELRPLQPYQVSGQRVGICRRCHHCLAVSASMH